MFLQMTVTLNQVKLTGNDTIIPRYLLRTAVAVIAALVWVLLTAITSKVYWSPGKSLSTTVCCVVTDFAVVQAVACFFPLYLNSYEDWTLFVSGVQLTVTLMVVMSDTFTLVGGSGSEDNRTILWRGTYIALEMGHGRLAHQTHDTGHVRHTSTRHQSK